MLIKPIDRSSLPLLSTLIDRLGSGAETFRYFDRRPIDIVLTHEAALLMVDGEEPVAYGHLEREGELVWLGVAVAQPYIGQGRGKQMVQALLDQARAINIAVIYLTVDKTNILAINLYKRLGFVVDSEGPHYWKYRYQVK